MRTTILLMLLLLFGCAPANGQTTVTENTTVFVGSGEDAQKYEYVYNIRARWGVLSFEQEVCGIDGYMEIKHMVSGDWHVVKTIVTDHNVLRSEK